MPGWVNQAFFFVGVGLTTSGVGKLLQIAGLLFGAIWKRKGQQEQT